MEQEHGVGRAMKASPDVCAEVVHRANEVLIAHEDIGEEDAKDDSENPGADETLDGFLGGELDKLSAPESNTAEIGEDVVADDQRNGQEKPDHSFEDVVHDEVGLHHDQVEGHVCPCELGKLESVVAGLERGDEENEAYIS